MAQKCLVDAINKTKKEISTEQDLQDWSEIYLSTDKNLRRRALQKSSTRRVRMHSVFNSPIVLGYKFYLEDLR